MSPADGRGALITDVGSTKTIDRRRPAQSPAGGNFVGSHPMAGSEKSGVDHSRETLLDGKLVVITPDGTTAPTHLASTEQLWRSLGARTLMMSPAEHDRAVAHTSHLPHILASALAGATPSQLLPLAASAGAIQHVLPAAARKCGDRFWKKIVNGYRSPRRLRCPPATMARGAPRAQWRRNRKTLDRGKTQT